MKRILNWLFPKEKLKPSTDLFQQAEQMCINHFKAKFGEDIKISIQVSEALKDSDLLGDNSMIYSGTQHHFVHYKK